jgi:hypothetical protein
VIGFLGNEVVATYRIRISRRIGSAALVADGLHARTDGFTWLAVLFGADGVALGYPLNGPKPHSNANRTDPPLMSDRPPAESGDATDIGPYPVPRWLHECATDLVARVRGGA